MNIIWECLQFSFVASDPSFKKTSLILKDSSGLFPSISTFTENRQCFTPLQQLFKEKHSSF